MKFCPICNNELQITYDHFYAYCMHNDHYYQYFVRANNQIARFNNLDHKQDINFASCDDVFKDYCYLEDFSILKNSFYEEAKSIYNKLKVFK